MTSSNPILRSIENSRATVLEKIEAYKHIRDNDPEVQAYLHQVPVDAEAKLILIADTLQEASQHIAEAGEIVGLKTGYNSLDDVVCGMREGEIVVVFGDTGMMKSTLVQNIALNVARSGKPVLFIGTEMVNVENTARFIEMEGSTDAVGGLPILYPEEIPEYREVSGLVEAASKQGAELVIIDHLHMFDVGTRNRADGIEDACREFKRVALKYKVPIMLVSHISENKDRVGWPDLKDLKGSSAIKQIATNALAVRIDENEPTSLKIKSRKNRRAIKRRVAELNILPNARLSEYVSVDYSAVPR